MTTAYKDAASIRREQWPNAKTPWLAAAGTARPVARFAWFVVAYNIVVTLWGAYVRTTGSGAGCGNRWPLCNGQLLPRAAQSQTMIEFAHRITSVLALALVFVLIVWCWRETSKDDWVRRAAVCSGILLLTEALLGALLVLLEYVGVDKSAGHAAFLCLHFGNTLLLLGALALTARGLSWEARLVWAAKPRQLIVIGIGLATVMAIGMTGSLAALADTIFPVESVQSSILQDFSPTSHVLLRLRLLHPIAAVFGATYIFWVVLKLWEKREPSQWTPSAIGATVALQIGLGVLNVFLLAPIWLQMAHLFVADVFWILLVVSSSELCLRPGNSQSQLIALYRGTRPRIPTTPAERELPLLS